MNIRSSTIPSFLLFTLLFFTPSCTSTGGSGEEEFVRFPAYRLEEVQNPPKETRKDRELARQIREHQNESMTPLQEIDIQSRIVEHLLTLNRSDIRTRVSGTGNVLASGLKGTTLPTRYFGRWFRLRGTPISTTNQPFGGHLHVDTSVQQFTMKNPADYEPPSEIMYYVIYSLEQLPPKKTSDVILEMDGLLWTTWELSASMTSSGKTPQSKIPVLFVKNFRYVEK